MSEHDEQVAVIEWAKLMEGKYPELESLHAIPNGGKFPKRRDKRGNLYSTVGKRMVKEGLKKGVLDLHLPVARRGYHSLYIEMKFGRNQMTKEQRHWFDLLQSLGNKCVVCWSAIEAIQVLRNYLGMED